MLIEDVNDIKAAVPAVSDAQGIPITTGLLPLGTLAISGSFGEVLITRAKLDEKRKLFE
jgi:hypothetical protein